MPKRDVSLVLFGLLVDSIKMFCRNVPAHFSSLSQCELSALITIVQLSIYAYKDLRLILKCADMSSFSSKD